MKDKTAQNEYFYNGHRLYNIKFKVEGLNINEHDIEANYMALPTLGNSTYRTEPNTPIEKRGRFYFKDLEIKPLNQ